MVLPFTGYLFYVCFGGFVSKYGIDKKICYFIYLAGFISALWIIFNNDNYKIGYKHLAVCLMAMSVFMVISKINIKPNNLILCISKCTWGIYLIHPLFINVAIKLINIDVVTSQAYVKLLIFSIIVFIISFFTTFCLRKIPFVKKMF